MDPDDLRRNINHRVPDRRRASCQYRLDFALDMKASGRDPAPPVAATEEPAGCACETGDVDDDGCAAGC